MAEYESGWGKIPQTIEEHINMIMGRYIETEDVVRCFNPKIGIFPYEKCLETILKSRDWERLNNFIYQENCVRSLTALTCGDTHYWAFLEMLGALAVGNTKTFELLLPDKMLFVPAHGLYQLAACVWDTELFQQLPMPDHKSFSKEYAVWRNSGEIQPTLYAGYPEPVISSVLANPELVKETSQVRI